MQVVEKIAKRPSAHGHPTFKDDPAFKSLSTQGLIVDPVWILKVIIYDEAGNAAQHDFPLTASEKRYHAGGTQRCRTCRSRHADSCGG
jgi:hypothetical protein